MTLHAYLRTPARIILNTLVARVANCALWFLKLPHSEAMEQGIFNVNILGGSSSVLELLETIGNSGPDEGLVFENNDILCLVYFANCKKYYYFL